MGWARRCSTNEEGGRRHGGHHEAGHHGRAGPAPRRRLDEPVGQAGEEHDGQRGAGRVDAAGARGVTRLGHVAGRDHEHGGGHGQVDEEDPAPRADGEEVAADQRPGGGRPRRPVPTRRRWPGPGRRGGTTPAGWPGWPGDSNAPPTPWSTRAPMSSPALGARPQRAEATANQTTPIEKIRLRPKRSPSEPPRSRKAARVSAYPVTTHCRVPTPPWKSRPMEGSAMPTTVESSMAMPEPSTVAATTHRPVPLERARGSATAGGPVGVEPLAPPPPLIAGSDAW